MFNTIFTTTTDGSINMAHAAIAIGAAFIIGFILQLVVIYTPGLNTNVFGLVALQLKDLLICLGLSFMIVIVMEIAKALGYKKHNN